MYVNALLNGLFSWEMGYSWEYMRVLGARVMNRRRSSRLKIPTKPREFAEDPLIQTTNAVTSVTALVLLQAVDPAFKMPASYYKHKHLSSLGTPNRDISYLPPK